MRPCHIQTLIYAKKMEIDMLLDYDIIKRLSEATDLLTRMPRTEVRGFDIISALRADKSASKFGT